MRCVPQQNKPANAVDGKGLCLLWESQSRLMYSLDLYSEVLSSNLGRIISFSWNSSVSVSEHLVRPQWLPSKSLSFHQSSCHLTLNVQITENDAKWITIQKHLENRVNRTDTLCGRSAQFLNFKQIVRIVTTVFQVLRRSRFSKVRTRWGEYIFSIYLILPASLSPRVYSAPNRNEYRKHKNNSVSGEVRRVRRADNFTAICQPIV
jgi:hypothetical protein